MPDPVDAILDRHGIRGPWEPLACTGVANRIYATRDVVLRVATDHPDAVPDARTESIAAPAARQAGLPVPELMAFDDSRTLVDRPYSLWERIHGETLGLHAPNPLAAPDAWRAVGRELARLHVTVQDCPDPNGWLDDPAHPVPEELRALAERLASNLGADAAEVLGWIDRITGALHESAPRCFLHDDIHAMNLMCRRDGSLLAIIDWGDAGWGDPALELAQVPVPAIDLVLDGYRSAGAGALLGPVPEARILADQLWWGLEDVSDKGRFTCDLGELRRFVARHEREWR